jgi:hypothetical protein
MKGVGLLVGTIFLLIICAVVYNNYGVREGFELRGPVQQTLVGPVPRKDLADLPSAPYSNMPDIPVPAQDPTQAKSMFKGLIALKTDMDAFQERLYPHMVEMADPTVQLPLMRFKGDYQNVKDEILVLAANPGLGVQLSEEEMETMRANLRFLNKKYHTLQVNQLVPTNTVSEGFTDSSHSPPITPGELAILNTKLSVEIARLQASGTSDPIIQSRINVFTKIQQSVADLLQRIADKRLDPTMIPIKKSDYNAFLPALGNNSVGIGGLLSSAGFGSLSSLFNAYDTGDISGSVLAENLMDRYADSILNGLSYSVSLSYTSQNELAKEMAKAATAMANTSNPRGEFEELMIQMEVDGFSNSESDEKGPAKFDWKERSQSICKAIGRLGLNPSDFGCMDPGAQVGPDYSWRGNARMVCTRAAAHSDPAIPEQVGCPPVSWKGWRN